MILKRLIAVLMICLFTVSSSFANSFTDRDRELLLKLSTDTAEIKGRLSEIDRRFDLIDLFWDRKTFVKEAKKIIALRELAKEDKKLEIVLKKDNLL